MWDQVDGFQSTFKTWLDNPLKTYLRRKSDPLKDVEPILEKYERLSPKKKGKEDGKEKVAKRKRRSAPLSMNGLISPIIDRLKDVKNKMDKGETCVVVESEDASIDKVLVSKLPSAKKDLSADGVFDSLNFITDKSESESIAGSEKIAGRKIEKSGSVVFSQDSGLGSQNGESTSSNVEAALTDDRDIHVQIQGEASAENSVRTGHTNSVNSTALGETSHNRSTPNKPIRRSVGKGSSKIDRTENHSSDEDDLPLAQLMKQKKYSRSKVSIGKHSRSTGTLSKDEIPIAELMKKKSVSKVSISKPLRGIRSQVDESDDVPLADLARRRVKTILDSMNSTGDRTKVKVLLTAKPSANSNSFASVAPISGDSQPISRNSITVVDARHLTIARPTRRGAFRSATPMKDLLHPGVLSDRVREVLASVSRSDSEVTSDQYGVNQVCIIRATAENRLGDSENGRGVDGGLSRAITQMLQDQKNVAPAATSTGRYDGSLLQFKVKQSAPSSQEIIISKGKSMNSSRASKTSEKPFLAKLLTAPLPVAVRRSTADSSFLRSIQLKNKRKTPPKSRRSGTENDKIGRRAPSSTLTPKTNQQGSTEARRYRAKVARGNVVKSVGNKAKEFIDPTAGPTKSSKRKLSDSECPFGSRDSKRSRTDNPESIICDPVSDVQNSVEDVLVRTEIVDDSVDMIDGEIVLTNATVPIVVNTTPEKDLVADQLVVSPSGTRRKLSPPSKLTDYVCKSGRRSRSLTGVSTDKKKSKPRKKKEPGSQKERFFLDGEPYNIMLRFIKEKKALLSQGDSETS